MPKRRANGEGSIYLRADGKWCAQYIDFNGRKRYLYGKTQQEVRRKLQDALRRKDDGYSLEPKAISVSDWVKEWLDNFKKPMLRESTYSASLLRWKHHIEPYFSKIKLNQLRAEQVQSFLNGKAVSRLDGKPGGYSVSMINLNRNRDHASSAPGAQCSTMALSLSLFWISSAKRPFSPI